MSTTLTYAVIFIVLLALELVYFKVAERFNIFDRPNERSSHSSIVLRGGGIIFLFGVWVWCLSFGMRYGLFMTAVTLAAAVSFIDDIRSLPDSVRLAVQFVATGLMIWQFFIVGGDSLFVSGFGWLGKIALVALAMIVCVGATNIYNFMDGINGITAGYSLAVLLPLLLVNRSAAFIEASFLIVTCIAVLVFSFFNFRNKGKAKCFAGDVGSVCMAYILLFAIGALIVRTGDVTWFVLLLVYGVDGCLTICHRIMLHEHLGEAHRKHAFQLMANELKMSHPAVALIYMGLQLAVSVGFIYLCPLVSEAIGLSLAVCHWGYLILALLILSVTYVLFMKKYYFLHEEYLTTIARH